MRQTPTNDKMLITSYEYMMAIIPLVIKKIRPSKDKQIVCWYLDIFGKIKQCKKIKFYKNFLKKYYIKYQTMGKKSCKSLPVCTQKCNSTFVTFTGALPTTPNTSLELTLTLTPAQQTILSQLSNNCAVQNITASFTRNNNDNNDIAFALNGSNTLFVFNLRVPDEFQTRPITGLGAGETAVGIVFRPDGRVLYLITVTAGDVGRIYTLNVSGTTAVATFVALISTLVGGTEKGTAFDPTSGNIKIVTSGQQNLTVNPQTGAATIDGQLPLANIVAAAYTNNVVGATSTQLFDIDRTSSSLYTQNPQTGVLTLVGSLGVSIDFPAGLDIQTDATTGTNTAFGTFTVGGTTGLYTVNLTAGTATLVGSFGAGNLALRSLAIAPAPAALLVVINQNDTPSGVSVVVPLTDDQVSTRACLPIIPTDTLSIVVTEINGGLLPTDGTIAVTLEITCNKCQNGCKCESLTNNSVSNLSEVEFTFGKNFGNKCKKSCN